MTISFTNVVERVASNLSSVTIVNYTIGEATAEALLVYTQVEDASGTDLIVTGVDYGSTALTNVIIVQEGSGAANRGEAWILLKADFPADITLETITVTFTGSTSGIHAIAMEVTAAETVSTEATGIANDQESQYDVSITTLTDGGMLFGGIGGGNPTPGFVTLDTEIHQRSDNSVASASAKQTAPATAGSATMSWTTTSAQVRENQLIFHLIEAAGLNPALFRRRPEPNTLLRM